jgi:NAD(P)-dependent dehydrogenase (short-subunit alcohol dehydrogenase family)
MMFWLRPEDIAVPGCQMRVGNQYDLSYTISGYWHGCADGHHLAWPIGGNIMKTILITGATSGIGLAAAEEMAARGWQVLGVGRTAEKCQQAKQVIYLFYPQAQLTYFVADLSSQQEVNHLATEVIQYLDQINNGRLDVLVNNAGTVRNRYTATVDGFETQFAVNHLAGFTLASRLLDSLRRSPAGRILTVSSSSHRGARIFWRDVFLRRHYSCLKAYKQSKFCNVLFTQEFNRREMAFTAAGAAGSPVVSAVRAFTVDPGLVNTDIGVKGTTGIVSLFWQMRKKSGLSPFLAASTIVHLCKMPDNWQPDGTYYKNCAPLSPDRRSFDLAAGRRLWDLSSWLCSLAGGHQRYLSPS